MSLTGLVSGDRALGFPTFHERAARVAAGLAAAGLGPGDSVALLLRNDFAFLEATVGAQKAGCYPVPVNWHSKGDEVRYVLEDCGARLLIGHASGSDGDIAGVAPWPELEGSALDALDRLLRELAREFNRARR